ncbi:MAG TPA: alpha/beta hydrolase [Saprospiraceae bacterium]|nr:alpha/beta hydrolase [Saprospiraceae bacterium]
MMENTLLLLHGALGSKEQFSALKQNLAPHFEVYDFNFSGHGNNTNTTEFSIEQFVQDTLTFLSLHDFEKVNIFEYSMGGYVALKLSIQYPEKVHKIMTLGTKMDWNKTSAEKEVSMLIPEIIEEKIPKFAENLRLVHMANDWKMILRKTADMMSALGNGAAMTADDFEKIINPVLICIGSADKMVSIEESDAVAQRLPNGELKIIPGFKHPMEMNDVEVLSGILLDFMSK